MQEYFRVTPPSVHQMVLTLERAGFIRRQSNTPRSIAMAQWRRGGMHSLVKVTPKGASPAPGRMTGYCTSLKFVIGHRL
jgi:hypothetical protein